MLAILQSTIVGGISDPARAVIAVKLMFTGPRKLLILLD